MFLFYQFFIFIFSLGLSIAGVFSRRIRKWNKDRFDHFNMVTSGPFNPQNKKVIWMHCSSLGEFEQGRPIMEALKKAEENCFFLLTFFSPSGYEISKNVKDADLVLYLPMDKPQSIKKWIKAIQPAIFIGVKYDFWWNMLSCLKASPCKVVYIAFQADAQKYYFNSFLPFKSILMSMDRIFTLDEVSSATLTKKEFKNNVWAGDPRVDRVLINQVILQKAVKKVNLPKKIVVYGSIYKSDLPWIEDTIMNCEDLIHVLVPHHPSQSIIHSFCVKFKARPVTFPQEQQELSNCVVTEVGHLMKWYAVADAVYVGGAREKGIHNTLEAAVFGIPVAVGKSQKSFPEITELASTGTLTIINHPDDFQRFIQTSQDKEFLQKVQNASRNYFDQNKGASSKITTYLKNLILSI